MNTLTNPPVSKYSGIKHKSTDAFNGWLTQVAKHIIWFTDGQMMWIDAHGEIVHCSTNEAIFNGFFVNMETMKPGENIQMYFQLKGWQSLSKLTVEKIETL